MSLIKYLNAQKKKRTKFRISIYTDVAGGKWWSIERKDFLKSWKSVQWTLRSPDEFREACFLKWLLEDGHCVYSHFKPSARWKFFNYPLS